MKYRVTIKKKEGADETRVIEAESRFAVYDTVQKEGAAVTAIVEGGGFVIPTRLNFTIGTGVRRRDIINMAKNLSAMLKAGLSLSRALSVLARQTHRKAFKTIIEEVGTAISQGSTFHEALSAHPQVFSKLFIAMVKAGEESGGLADSLLVVGTQIERADELIRKIRGAMIYPAIVLTAIVIVGILMLMFVVPTLTETFKELKVELPLSTRVITALSDFLANHVFIVLIGLVGIVLGIIAFGRSQVGRKGILDVMLLLPVIGELARETFAARAARTLSSLLSAGVPMLSAIAITEDVVGAERFSKVLAEAGVRVKKGDPLSAAFIEHPNLYPIMMSDMIAVGEETGKLSEMLVQVAEYYENDVGQKTKDLSTIIEPILMLFVGGMVGVFAVSMISPIYSLSSAI